jgi:stage II sporulation protein AB (anti-sigma F factor)
VSEAVTNAIIHGYGEDENNVVILTLSAENKVITIEISDSGVGIENIESAREPLFTTKPEMERSGLGFTVMESFMDSVEVTSTQSEGTTVKLTKELAGAK